MDLPKQPVDVAAGANHQPPYNTEINRTGQVPALKLDSGLVLTEILPICEYVERMTEACVVQAGPIRDHYASHNYKTMLPPEMGAICAAMAREKLTWFDAEMSGRQFVCGDRFTLADIQLYVFLEFFEMLGLGYPRECSWVDEFFGRVGARPSASA